MYYYSIHKYEWEVVFQTIILSLDRERSKEF